MDVFYKMKKLSILIVCVCVCVCVCGIGMFAMLTNLQTIAPFTIADNSLDGRTGQFPPMGPQEEEIWENFSEHGSYKLFMERHPDGIHKFWTSPLDPTKNNMMVHKMNHTNQIILELYLEYSTDENSPTYHRISESLHCRDIANERYFLYPPIQEYDIFRIGHHVMSNFCLDGEIFYKDSDIKIDSIRHY